MPTETSLRKEMLSVLYRNRDNFHSQHLNRLHSPPGAPSTADRRHPLKDMLVDSKVKQVAYGKRQLWFTLGTVLRGKTFLAGVLLEASQIINDHFGLMRDIYLNWEDDQALAQSRNIVPPGLQSGPRNTSGCYGDSEYQAFNLHYALTLNQALQENQFVLSDCAHMVDRGELALRIFSSPGKETSSLDYESNGVYVSANRDIVDLLHGAPAIRETAAKYPEHSNFILELEGRPIPDEPFRIRGGGYNPTLEYLRQEEKFFAELILNGAIHVPEGWSLNQLNNPNYHAQFVESIFTPYFFENNPMTRYSVVRNRELTDRQGWPIQVPPGLPIIEKVNFYK